VSDGRGLSLDDLLRRPEQRERLPPCRSGCPGGADVRRWVGWIAQREQLGLSLPEAMERAWLEVVARNPFPAVMGRVCPHPCEDGCNRGPKDGAVAINAMERYLGDWAIEHRLRLPRLEGGPWPESIGVVGAGPAGLSFAYQMARRGYRTRVYERGELPGGMLLRGIPEYRLPEEVLRAEITRILALGVELELGVEVGRAPPFAELRERHAAIFLAVGAQRGRGLGVPGEEGAGVVTGIAYLEAYNRGEPLDLGRRVAVVGGGNTAIDAARALRRRGCEVTLVYRRGRGEMPALEREVEEALEEGVKLEVLAAPVAVRREDGRPRALELVRMRLGEADASGRRAPHPVSGTEWELALDGVVAAISQEPDWSGLEELGTGAGWLRSGEAGEVAPGIWGGGDARGLGIASLAIAQGRLAAEAVHARLRGLERQGPLDRPAIGTDAVRLDRYAERARNRPENRSAAERLAEPDAEVTPALAESAFLDEAGRCLSCGSCFGCQSCAMYCNPDGFTRLAEAAPGAYFAWSPDACEGCGKCLEVCPCGFLSLRESDA